MPNMAFREVSSWDVAELNVNGGFLCKVTTKRDQKLLGIVNIGESAESGVLKIPIEATDGTLGQVLVQHNLNEITELDGDLKVAFGLMGLEFNREYRDLSYDKFTGSSSGGYPDINGISLSVVIYGHIKTFSEKRWQVSSYTECLIEAVGMLAIVPMHVES